MPVAYNPSDPVQQNFLGSLAQGESGGNYTIGWGNTDLSNASAGAYGFPQWSGKPGPEGPSHAAGAFQFQPGTWSDVASKYNLDFRNPADQNAGAWYHAQDVYAAKTGGDLETDLQAGQFSKIANNLKTTWTSIKASSLASGVKAALADGPTSTDGNTPSLWTDPVGAVSTYFVRGGMILIGAVILAIALWAILSNSNGGKLSAA